MAPFLIDSTGVAWARSDVEQMRRRFGGPPTEAAFARHAVAELGFIEVEPARRHITLRLGTVESHAITTLLFWLGENGGRVRLTTLDGAPPRLYPHEEAVRFLTLFAEPRASTGDLFLCEPKLPGQTVLGRQLPRIADALRSADTVGVLPVLCRQLLGGRYTLTRLASGSSRLVIIDTGEGYTNLSSTWYQMARGLTFEDSPDYPYGRWVMEAHTRALATNAPIVDYVDALVAWPRSGRVRTCYERLIYPFQAPDGQRWVLSTSRMRDRIDLRGGAEPGDEPGQV